MQTFASPRECFKQKNRRRRKGFLWKAEIWEERVLGMPSPPIQKPSLRDETASVKVLTGNCVSLDEDT
jgi:hypothetical protein